MAEIVVDQNYPTSTGTDTIVGANTPLRRVLVPEGKRWTFDPAKHQHRIGLLDTAGAALVAGSQIYLYKAGNNDTGSRVIIKQFSEGLLPTLANQANKDYSGGVSLPSFHMEAGQELQLFVFVPVGGVACDELLSTWQISLDEVDNRAPAAV
ncbi:MAG: hypothetical protein KAS32_00775 [Candidatus Peribacteraceae bacterium]|nr:hypothetical protein [Candidatus Peribacteraceae bacterium]